MTKWQYRVLYIGAILLALAPQAFQPHIADPETYWKRLQAVSDMSGWMKFVMVYPLPVATLVSLYGTFRFRSWAVWLNLILTCIYLGSVVVLDVSMVIPAPAQAMQTLAHYAWGAVMALPFFSRDVREMFWPRQAGS
ncbi:hypothetical protein D3C72_646370 [compost metagenome]